MLYICDHAATETTDWDPDRNFSVTGGALNPWEQQCGLLDKCLRQTVLGEVFRTHNHTAEGSSLGLHQAKVRRENPTNAYLTPILMF